jgi:hypothetical protein
MKVNLNDIEANYIIDKVIVGPDFDLLPGDTVTVYEVWPLGLGLTLQVVSLRDAACADDKRRLEESPELWRGWFDVISDGTCIRSY